MKTGLYLSAALLIAALAVAFWPILTTARFWVSLALVVGIVGTFFFAVATAQKRQD
jgi:hypothetical protein